MRSGSHPIKPKPGLMGTPVSAGPLFYSVRLKSGTATSSINTPKVNR